MCYELDLPLNSLFVLIEQQQWKDIKKAMKIFPGMGSETFEVAKFYDEKTSSKVSALHLACKYEAPPAVLESLYKENPKQFFMLDSRYQRTPLHIAVMNGIPHSSLEVLIKYNPKATEVRDALGRLPLHYACRDNKKENVKTFQSLIKSNTRGARVPDASGFLPVHVACRCNAPLAVVRLLLQVAPDTIFQKTKKGSSVMSCAKLGRCPDTVINYLEKSAAAHQQQQQ